MADRMDGRNPHDPNAPERRSIPGAPLGRPVPPPIRRDGDSRPVHRNIPVPEPDAIGPEAEPSDLPTFTRTTGGTITTFLPTEPPGSRSGRRPPAPSHKTPEPKPRIDNDSHDPFFATETGDINTDHPFFALTSDFPASTFPLQVDWYGLDEDRQAMAPERESSFRGPDGFDALAPIHPIDTGLPQVRPTETTLRPPSQAEPHHFDSDEELDALLADLSAAKPQSEMAPIHPAPQIQPRQEPRPRPEPQPIDRPTAAPRQTPLAIPPVIPPVAKPAPAPLSSPTPTPQPWGPQQAPQQREPARRIVPSDPPAAVDHRAPIAPVAPVANLPLGAPQDYYHPMDGEVGRWIRIIAVLLAGGLAAGAVAFAILS